jgi:hypothetical protein
MSTWPVTAFWIRAATKTRTIEPEQDDAANRKDVESPLDEDAHRGIERGCPCEEVRAEPAGVPPRARHIVVGERRNHIPRVGENQEDDRAPDEEVRPRPPTRFQQHADEDAQQEQVEHGIGDRDSPSQADAVTERAAEEG